ncbi:MAG TPA: hypothetical protein VMI54_13195 [Polyangiaceae bacterium]|nr:hypothetical protein [Polyangiaceae bacterium]
MRLRLALVIAALGSSWAGVAAAEPNAAVPSPPAASTPPAASAPPAVSAPPAASTPRTAVVLFRADHPDAVLESDWAPNDAPSPWYVLCATPCEERVVADARLRVSGPGLYASRTFKLPLDRDRVAVTATMESRSVAGGVVLLAVGYALLGVTSPALVVGGLAREHGGTGLVVSGIGVGIAGAVAGGLGLMLMVRRAQYKESRVRMAHGAAPRLELPGGLGLEARGLTF